VTFSGSTNYFSSMMTYGNQALIQKARGRLEEALLPV
jgi:hypothetical protein